MPVPPGTTSPAPAHANRLTVLFATPSGTSENETWHHTVRHLLAPQGINLVYAQTGREALSLLESSIVHLAVLDSRLPQLGGLQVIKLVREHKRAAHSTTPDPATILLADTLTNALLHDALGQSVFTVLAKPVNHNQLLDAMARAMRRFHNSQWPNPGHLS